MNNHPQDAIPCFVMLNVPVGFYYLDCGCESHSGSIDVWTNVSGKAATYFNTQMHGGDNFKFKASIENTVYPQFSCKDSEPDDIFTVWRKIYFQYAYMAARNGQYPSGCSTPQSKEFTGIHEINGSNYSDVKGAFDDCFIEIADFTGNNMPNTPYRSHIDNTVPALGTYGDTYTVFRGVPPIDPPKDTIVFIGVDHLDDDCGGPWGGTVAHWTSTFYDDAFYSAPAVGYIHDWFLLNPSGGWIDQNPSKSPNKAVIVTCCHELGHSLAEKNNKMHTEFPHGIMSVDDKRSYFHLGHIMAFRAEISKFDSGY